MSTMTEVRPQWRVALDNGNRIRLARAAYKRDLAQHRTMRSSWSACAELVKDPPQVLEGMKLRELLEACRWCGPAKVDDMLRATGIGNSFTVGSLTHRQRIAIATLLRHGSMEGAPDVSGMVR